MLWSIYNNILNKLCIYFIHVDVYDVDSGGKVTTLRLQKQEHVVVYIYIYIYSFYIYYVYTFIHVDMYDIDSGGKVTTLQPGGENKM